MRTKLTVSASKGIPTVKMMRVRFNSSRAKPAPFMSTVSAAHLVRIVILDSWRTTLRAMFFNLNFIGRVIILLGGFYYVTLNTS